MFGSETLEVIIGLVFVYLLFSILVTLLIEYVSAILRLRSRNLKQIIRRVLDDEGNSEFSELFFHHPMIKFLARKEERFPSYISSEKFTKAVLDIIRTGGQLKKIGSFSHFDNRNSIVAVIEKLEKEGVFKNTETLAILKSMANEAGNDINDFGRRIEAWFNETVERGQGWFKRKIQLITIIISLLVTVSFNIDSVFLYQQLSKNSTIRTELIDGASTYITNNNPQSNPEKTRDSDSSANPENADSLFLQARENLIVFYREELTPSYNLLGIGWSEDIMIQQKSKKNWFLFAMLGWLITAFAVSLGAPFWFGILSKVGSLRSSGKAQNQEDENCKVTGSQVREGTQG